MTLHTSDSPVVSGVVRLRRGRVCSHAPATVHTVSKDRSSEPAAVVQ